MEPDNQPFERKIIWIKPSFLGSIFHVFGGVYNTYQPKRGHPSPKSQLGKLYSARRIGQVRTLRAGKLRSVGFGAVGPVWAELGRKPLWFHRELLRSSDLCWFIIVFSSCLYYIYLYFYIGMLRLYDIWILFSQHDMMPWQKGLKLHHILWLYWDIDSGIPLYCISNGGISSMNAGWQSENLYVHNTLQLLIRCTLKQ